MASTHIYKSRYVLKFKTIYGATINCYIQEYVPINEVFEAKMLKGSGNKPISIRWSKVNDYIYTSKAEINIVLDDEVNSVSDLFTNDPFKYRVEVYEDDTFVWSGFLDTEIYSQGIRAIGSNVTLYANDGIALLKRFNTFRINFTEVTPDYSIYSLHSILVGILDEANIQISSILYNTSLRNAIIGTTSTTNILSKLYININNFYKADGSLMNLFDILTEIMKAFNLKCLRYGYNLYVYDDYAMYGNNSYLITDKVAFPPEPTTFETKYNQHININNLVKPTYTFIPARNSFKVVTSTYSINTLPPIAPNEGTVSGYEGTTNYLLLNDYSYKENLYANDSGLININTNFYKLVNYIGTGLKNQSTNITVIRLLKSTPPNLSNYAFKIKTPYLFSKENGKYVLQVKLTIKVRTKQYPEAPDDLSPSKTINKFYIKPIVKLGDKYVCGYDNDRYNAGYYTPVLSDTLGYYPLGFFGDAINDKLVNANIYIPLYTENQGIVEIIFNNYFSASQLVDRNSIDRYNDVISVDIYKIELYIVDRTKPKYYEIFTEGEDSYRKVDITDYELADAIDYSLEMYNSDTNWITKDNTINTIIGTNYDGFPTSLSSLLYKSGDKYFLLTGGWYMNPNSGLSPQSLESFILYERYLQMRNARIKLNFTINNFKFSQNVIHPAYKFYEESEGKVYALNQFTYDIVNGKLVCEMVELKNY